MEMVEKAKRKILVFVGTPIKHYFDNFEVAQALRFAKRHAIEVSKEVRNLSEAYTPIAPALVNLDVYCEKTERDVAFESAVSLLLKCDAYAYRVCDMLISGGIKQEIEIAKKMNLEIIEL